VETIAFPSISTGIYGYPVDRAASIAVATIRDALYDDLLEVILVAFSEGTESALRRALAN